MKKLVKKVLGDPEAKTLKRMRKRVKDVNALQDEFKKLSDSALRRKTEDLQKKLSEKGQTLDSILPEAFATVREMAWREIKQRHYDVQLIGGMVLHEGMVAEMKTGEGKTLVATLPVYLNALSGKGVHVVTVNDYLAQRDAGWMGQIYYALGLSCAVIIPDHSYVYDPEYNNEDHEDPRFRKLRPCTRQEAYAADITYGTNNEFGFDYLRDNMVREVDQLRQRELNFAIVDEVDSILIDEARTPLIISAPSATSGAAYEQFSKLARQLKRDKHFEVDEKRRAVTMTDEGITYVEKALGISNLYDSTNIRTIYHLDQALRAEALFKRDKDYVVTNDGEIVIVDEFTGRLLKGRRYNEGLHQAIEAKEHVEVQEESMTLATISFQNYFRLYDKLSGMTGTAKTEEEEFHQIYKLEVVEIPTNRPLARTDMADKIYRSKKGKYDAIANQVKELQEKGQPVLIGTSAIEHNEELSKRLKKAGVKHEVLNAKNNEREAHIVAEAGQKGAVTLATNIAGRGTDIVLGEGVKELGGLYVIGSERHESRRIDNQLRGRSGRQGDPGETQFYVSTEDDLMRVFGGDRIRSVMNRLKIDDETPIQNRVISKSLEAAQKRVEGFNFDTRKNVVQYDDVMNRHRVAVYTLRKEVLKQANITGKIKDFLDEQVKAMVGSPDSYTDAFELQLKDIFNLEDAVLDKLFNIDAEKFEKELQKAVQKKYDSQTEDFGKEIMEKVERDIYLQVMDNLWMQHLESMDHLRQGIHWISVGQRDPLVEYRRQSKIMFEEMQNVLRHDVIRALFHARPVAADDLDDPIETELTRAARSSVDNADRILLTDESFDAEDFSATSGKKARNAAGKKHNVVKKKRKAQRQNKKKSRRK
ncbi:preprotein translocase subunit SecA [Candidatus Saccharibacteria bacterium]|nr:preprotein translocase subunit SecA [Candidatus Saccharibacteria bacterium]